MKKLYLKGNSVLKMEAEVAKRSQKLLILNPSNLDFNEMSKVTPQICLVE